MPSDSYTLIISDAGVTTPISGSVTNASVASDAAISFSKLATLTSGNILVGSSANVPTSVALTGDINVSNTGVAAIASGVVVNADVNASAAIAYSKLASLTSGNILVGNSSNVPTSVGVTGDVTISNTGVTSIESGVIVNADINASAAIAHSKLASMSSGNILVGSSGSVPTSVAVTGDITVSNTGIAAIASGVIVNADINASAAIAHSKLASLTSGNILVGNGSNVPTSVAVTGDVTISNAGVTSLQASPTLVTPILGTPTSGTLTSCTGLPVSTGISGLGAGVAAFLATPSSANLAATVTDETGSGALVFATSPTLVTPILGTPTSGTLTSCTGLPVSTGVSGFGTGVATFLATPSSANLAAAVTNETGSGALVFATSPTLVTPILGTPTSGTLTSCTGLPLTTGVTGTLPVAYGGTGVTSSTGSGANVLSNTPTLVTPNLGTPTSGTLTSCTGLPVSTGVSGLGTGVAAFLATPSSANLATAVTGETGSGALVFATSPSLTTPILGTPTSGTLTSCTGLPLTTGVIGTLPIANGGTGVTQSAYGECYISSVAATTIATAGVYAKVAGSTTADNLSNFTHPANNRLTYTGTATRKFAVTAALSFHGNGTNDYKFAFYKNGSSILSSSIISSTGTGTGNLAHVSCQCIVQLAINEYIEMFVTNADATNNATVDFMNIRAVTLI